jgi:hypothetical protein
VKTEDIVLHVHRFRIGRWTILAVKQRQHPATSGLERQGREANGEADALEHALAESLAASWQLR